MWENERNVGTHTARLQHSTLSFKPMFLSNVENERACRVLTSISGFASSAVATVEPVFKLGPALEPVVAVLFPGVLYFNISLTST